MPGCVLRATGDDFQAEKFLGTSTLSPCNVFRKGERKSRDRVWDTSGMTVVVSDASGDEPGRQIREAISFLATRRDELKRLRSFDGLTEMELDFGLSRKNGFAQNVRFPSELTAIVGELRMGIEVSIYGEGEAIG
jgi:hypothetical protein